MNPKLEETIYVDFITSSPTTGAATDADSTPSCEVFEDATDTGIITPTPVKRTGKTGDYRVQIDCTAANGFETAKSYNVVVSATVGGIAAKSVISSFQMRTRCIDDVMPTYTQPSGFLAAIFSGTIANTTNITTATGITVATNNDKTGYSLSQSFPTNFSSLAIDSSGRVNAFLIGILTSVFTEGAVGRIAAAFKQFFNIASPTATMDHGVLVDTVTTATTASALTTNNDKTGYALTAAYDLAKTAAQAGDAMTLTAGERTSVGTAVWASATRSLTTFGTLVADVTTAVWAAASRTLTAFGFTVDTNANATETAIKTVTDKITFTVANQVDANTRSINSTTITGDGQPGTEFGV